MSSERFHLNFITDNGDVSIEYASHIDRIVLWLGSRAFSMHLTVDQATAIKAQLDEAIDRATWDKCPACNGARVIEVDGKPKLCESCDGKGMVPR